MSSKKRNILACGFDEDALIAEALGDANPSLRQTVHDHLRLCSECAQRAAQYRDIQRALHSWPTSDTGLTAARRALDRRLAQHAKPRMVVGVWNTALGPLRIGRTDKGVALLEFIAEPDVSTVRARFERVFSVDRAGPDEADLSSLEQTLDAYLTGARHTPDWAIDEGLMRSEFQRRVLRATSRIPYGTLATYMGIAHAIGQPAAVRAVAQALRHNPVPIQIPCHRVIGSNGSLTGYAGNRVELKRDILAVEGIPVEESKTGLCVARQRLYVADQPTRVFCRPDCAVPRTRSAADRLLVASPVRAKEIGYAPCGVCRPDAEPLHVEAALRLL